jgi:hypothetical protein
LRGSVRPEPWIINIEFSTNQVTVPLGRSGLILLSLWVGLVGDAGGEGGEAVAVVVIMTPAGRVPSPRFNNKPRVMAFINLLPEVDRGSVMKVGLEWI